MDTCPLLLLCVRVRESHVIPHCCDQDNLPDTHYQQQPCLVKVASLLLALSKCWYLHIASLLLWFWIMPTLNEADKVVFFDQLYALAQVSDDEGDINEQPIPEGLSRQIQQPSSPAVDVQRVAQTPDIVNNIPSLHRIASEPMPTLLDTSIVIENSPTVLRHPRLRNVRQSTPLAKEVSLIEDTPPPQQQIKEARRGPRRTVSAPTPSAMKPSSIYKMDKPAFGKRKREEASIKLVSEARQIFKGYTFFYIPNDDVAPVRRIRITKAREHGALWTTAWSEDVTHIIVDKVLTYQDVVRFLKVSSIPIGIVAVVDTYPIDCIQFRAILDPTQNQYRVKGHQQALLEKFTQIPVLQVSDKSLDIKPARSKSGKRNYVPPRGTPPRNGSSTQKCEIVRPLERLSGDSSPGIWLAQALKTESTVSPEEENDRSKYQRSLESPENIAADLGGGDILDEFIREARALEHLPLDEDSRPSSRDDSKESGDPGDESSTSSPHKRQATSGKGSNKNSLNQESFSCMKGGTGKTTDSNPNTRTISILQEMADYYTRINDTWRPNAYRRAITTLLQQPTKVTSSEEALNLPFIGQRLALKIEEIVNTDRLRRLEDAKTSPNDRILQNFMDIYGVGFNQANKWLHSGYATLEDLKAYAHLTDNQRLGIEHYDDFLTRIPRDEVTALGNIVKTTAAAIDPEVEIIIGGSYRRGAVTSGDIDCIVTKPNTSSSSDIFDFLMELVARLTSSNFLVAALAIPQTKSGTKWHGCCVLPGATKPIWRRIDFLLAPASELGAALIYFTGNDIFNRSIRLLASRKGMRLNQRGLYKDVMRGPGRLKMNEGELIEGANEKGIFAALNVPWRPPEQRIC